VKTLAPSTSIKGIVDAFVPGMWYTKPEAIRRFLMWFCGVGLGQILGGLISWVTQVLNSDGYILLEMFYVS
jgi:hypothetical protein